MIAMTIDPKERDIPENMATYLKPLLCPVA
jgi:hypothetical protein